MHELMNTTKEVFGKIEKNGEQGQAAKNQAQENLKYDFWLASLLYIDSRKRIRVREMCGSAQAVYELKEETLKNKCHATDDLHIFICQQFSQLRCNAPSVL